MQQQVEDTERDAIFERLRAAVPENNKCFDCDKKNPKWASVTIGLYLCLDCAGKHREYGPQITFVRSINLDSWNRRYITFMELGGNVKAKEYFRKFDIRAPYDYKSAQIQKYKQELTRKVDAILESNNKTQEEANKPIFASKPVEDTKSETKSNLESLTTTVKSHSDKPSHGESAKEEDPFANNIVLNKAETKTKGFSVEFSKNKPAFGNNKGRIAAKKIDNFDLESLSLNEDGANTVQKNNYSMSDNTFSINTKTDSKSNVKEVLSKGNSPYLNEESAEEKFKKFSSAKAISSDAFKNEKQFEPSNVRKFAGASAISSSQYFGEKEDNSNEEGIDYYQTAEYVKDVVSHYGGKLKEKAGGLISKLKNEWQ